MGNIDLKTGIIIVIVIIVIGSLLYYNGDMFYSDDDVEDTDEEEGMEDYDDHEMQKQSYYNKALGHYQPSGGYQALGQPHRKCDMYYKPLRPSAHYTSNSVGAIYDRELNITDPGGYQETIKNMSLEPNVHRSHKRFTKDVHRRTTGASVHSLRDDPNDVVPWIGLRRPRYRTQAQSQHGSRTVHSEHPIQMRENRPFVLW